MRSEIVAATCIYLAFKWSEFEVGLSTDGRVRDHSFFIKRNFDSYTLRLIIEQPLHDRKQIVTNISCLRGASFYK